MAAPFLWPILFPVSWFSLVPLFFALGRATGLGQVVFTGLLAGIITNLAGFYWLGYTIRVFGGYSYLLSGLIFFFFAVYSGLPFALFCLSIRGCGWGPFCLLPPLFWIAIEFWYPLLFPWHLANSQVYFLPLIQSADLVGPYGTSFLIVWANAFLFQVGATFLSRAGESRFPLREAAVGGLLLVGAVVYGYWRLDVISRRMGNAPALSLAAVQGNISIRHKGKTAYLESNLGSYRRLTEKIHGARLVIWPESAVEAWIPAQLGQLPRELAPPLPPDASYLLFGVRSFQKSSTHPDLRAFNSAYLADGRGRVLGRYHKQVLLAFGEYIPLSPLLSRLPAMPPIGSGFSPGKGSRTLDLSPDIRLAPLICYEDLMPWLSRSFVRERGANLLVNLTNDAWFGNTVAPWQHARLAQWRAVETRRSLVRATNTGLTAVIDPRGQLLEALPIFTSGVLRAKVPLMEGETPYVRFGDWFAWMCTVISLSVLAVALRGKCWRPVSGRSGANPRQG